MSATEIALIPGSTYITHRGLRLVIVDVAGARVHYRRRADVDGHPLVTTRSTFRAAVAGRA